MFYKETIDKEPEQWAIKFRKALADKKLLSPSAIGTTVSEFCILKKSHSSEEINKVLNWYCIHAGEPFVPLIKNAKQFKSRFSDLVRAKERSVEASPDLVSETYKEMAKRLKDSNFPVEIESNLEVILQASGDSWKKFVAVMEIYIASNDSHNPGRSFLQNVIGCHNATFLTEWMSLIQEQYGWKDHYLGQFKELVFKPYSNRFKEHHWRQWSKDWCGFPAKFDSLLEELQKC